MPSGGQPGDKPAFKRILLKLSGEALMGDDAYGINPAMLGNIVAEIKAVSDLGVEIGIVIGAGNIFRGMAGASSGMDRATADYMGMLATVMNSMALSDALRQAGVNSRVQSALGIEQVVEPYIRGKAIRYLEEGKIVVFAAGTGNPFSPPTRQQPCAAPRSARRSGSRRPRWTAFTAPIRKKIPAPNATRKSALMMRLARI